MGIKYFSRLLRECEGAISYYPISTFKGKRIGIDLLGMGYNLWSIAHRDIVKKINVLSEDPEEEKIRNLFYQLVRDFLNKLFLNEITPIFIIDGDEKHSDEKAKHTKSKRRKDKQNRIDRVKTLKEKIAQMDQFEVSSAQIKELNQAHLNNSIFSRESVALLIELITTLGIPILKSQGMTGEADKLCAYLCDKGYLAGVFTSDRDVLIFKSPLIITKFVSWKYNKYTKKQEPHVEVISLKKILEGTGLTYRQLVDVAILAGCDYNEKLPRYGIIKIKNLIKKYGSIEALIKEGYKVSMTNYKVCRKYFMAPETYNELCQNPDFKLQINFSIIGDYSKLEERLSKFGIEDWMNQLGIHYQIMKQCKVIPIKTKNGVINIKIRTNPVKSSLTNTNDWVHESS